MKTKNLVILAAVVLVVFAYIFFVERHRPTTGELDRDADKVLQDFNRDEVAEISITRDGGLLRLEKDGEAWRLVEPIDFPADDSVVTSTLGSLANLTSDRRIALSEIDLADFGLDNPSAEVALRMIDGGETVLSVGGEMPLGSNRAVLVQGSDEMLVTTGWFVSDLEREIDEWRSRDVVDLSVDDVAAIDIDTDADSIRAVRADGRWQLEEPLEDVADKEHLGSLISDLNSLRIEEFLDDGVDPSELGLVTPEYEIRIARADGRGPVRLDLGATREGTNGVEVACRRGDDLYFWAGDRVRTRLSKAPVLWRSPTVAPFETWKAVGLRLARDGETVELEGGDVPWQFADGVEATLGAVQDRLSKLAGLTATDFDLMAPITSEMGTVEVVLEGEGDDDVEDVIVFTFYDPLSEGGRVMVRASNRDNLMAVEAEDAEAILGHLDDFRPAIDSEDAG